MFRLTKWYLDLVTVQGTALIAYAGSLEWEAVRTGFAATFLARPGAEPVEQTAWLGVQAPEVAGDALGFRHQGLQVSGEWRRAASPVEVTLLDEPAGKLHWACLFPSAMATVTLKGETLAGQGYAECLSMTRPPWSLPFRRLRWGRYTGSAHSAVWIEWGEGLQRQWVWLDGAAQPGAGLDDQGISGLDGRREIRLAPERELCDRRTLQVISSHLPALAGPLAGPLRNLRQAIRLARGTLHQDGAPVDHGWTIHELVTW